MDIYQLLTLVIFVLVVIFIVVVAVGLYISGRRERAEQVAQADAKAPAVAATEPVAAGGFFSGVSSSNAVIVDAARENTSRTATPEQRARDDFDL